MVGQRKFLKSHGVVFLLVAVLLLLVFSASALAQMSINVQITDSDADHVYYYRDADTPDAIQFKVTGVPELSGPDNVTAEFGQYVDGVFTSVAEASPGEAEAWEEFAGTYDGTSAYDFSFTIPDSYDNDDLPLGVRVRVYQGGVVTQTYDTLLSASGTPSANDLAFVNFYPGKDDGIMIIPDPGSSGVNLKATTNLSFYFWGKGSITFDINAADPVNLLTVDEDNFKPIISNLSDLVSLEEGFSKSATESSAYFAAEVDTSSSGLSCLEGIEATVNFFNSSQYHSSIATDPDLSIAVYDNSGNLVGDASSYIDPADIQYIAGVLNMPVKHFTRFVLTTDFGAPATITVGASGCDYTTIQAAVDAANPGDTILVSSGVYGENVTVDKSGLTIQSVDGADSTMVISASAVGGPYHPVFRINSRNVTIEGFTITAIVGDAIYLNDVSSANIVDNSFNVSGDASSAIGIECDSVTNGTLSITGNTFDGFGSSAFYVSGDIDDSTVEIDDNEFNDCDSAIYFSDYAGANAPATISITDNTFDTIVYSAVYVREIDRGSLTVTGNQITACNIGVEIPFDSGQDAPVNITVSDNDFTNMTSHGITIYTLYQGWLDISDNTMTDCHDGIYLSGYYGEHGEAHITVTGNEIGGSTSNGIYVYNLYLGSLDVSDNTLTDCYDGIYLSGNFGYDAPSTVTVTGNQLTRCSDYGIYFYGMYLGSLLVSENTATDCSYGFCLEDLGTGRYETDVHITDNIAMASGTNPGWDLYYGFYICCPERFTYLSNNEVSGYNYGIYCTDIGCCGIEPLEFTVNHNEVSDCGTGMHFEYLPCCISGNIHILNNILTDNADYGMYIEDIGNHEATVDLKGNVFSGNSTGLYVYYIYEDYATLYANYNGFIDNDVSYDTADDFAGVDLTACWWASADGPTQIDTGVGDLDMVTAGADVYTPWVTSVAANQSSISLKKGATSQLAVTATLSDASTVNVTNYTAEFTSSNESVATVSDSGLVTAVANGTATITINCMGIILTDTVTVTEGSSGGSGGSTVVQKTDPLAGPIISTITGSLNSNGGTFHSKDGFVQIMIPSGAFSGTNGSWQIAVIEVDPDSTVGSAPQIANGTLRLVGNIADIDLSDLEQPFVARFYYDADQITNPANLRIFYWNEEAGNWVPISLENSTINQSEGYIEVTLYHCTRFAVMEVLKPTSFADVGDKWYASYVERLALMGITNGYTQNGVSLFKPDATITRAEFAVFLANALGLSGTGNTIFADAALIPSWAANDIGAAASAGIITGYNDNTFRPDREITRAEMAVMIARTAELAASSLAPTFADAASIPSWATGAVTAVAENGIVDGQSGNLFNPLANATRAEAAKMIINLLGVVAGK